MTSAGGAAIIGKEAPARMLRAFPKGTTTMKGASMKRGYSLAAIAVLAWMSTSPSLAQVAEQKIWPSISPTQWFWHEPKTDLTPDRIVLTFRDVTANKTTFLDPEVENSVLLAKYISVTAGKPKDRKGSAKVDGIKIDAELQGTEEADLTKVSCFIALDAIREMDLWYVSNVQADNWRVRLLADQTRTFFFGEEDLARRFMDAVASALMPKALRLNFSKFGLLTENLTPEQAEALGKTRIESVLVTSLAIDGPADKAGIQPLDVIEQINGIKLRNISHFSSLVDAVVSGSTVSVTLLQRAEVPNQDPTQPKQYVWNPKTVELIAR